MIHTRILSTVMALGIAVFIVPTSDVNAQEYPTRPITLTLPFNPGGVVDVVARRLHPTVSQYLKQPVVIDYKQGAGGVIGTTLMTKAPPDGYNLMMVNNSVMAINPHLLDNLQYKPTTDFAPVTMLVSFSHILVVPKDSTVKSVDDLVARAKTGKGLNYASQGIGSGGHLIGEMFRAKTGAQFNHIPYKGAAAAMQDLLGGRVDLYFDAVSNVTPHLRAGSLRALATTASKRLAQYPDLPTMAELGYEGVQSDAWFALFVPAGTPQPIIQRLNAEFGKALRDEAVAKPLRELGLEVVPGTPEDLAATLAADLERLGPLIRQMRAESK
jgi:tripartite-type tricarboxylate transporter receptor subunit TctC